MPDKKRQVKEQKAIEVIVRYDSGARLVFSDILNVWVEPDPGYITPEGPAVPGFEPRRALQIEFGASPDNVHWEGTFPGKKD